MNVLTVVVGLVILLGLTGVVVPLLPGLPLVWAAVLVWASGTQTTTGWAVLGIATILAVSGFLLQYLVPGRRLAKTGVTTSSAVAGVALGLVGFFLIPVIGAFVGFAVGVYLAERVRLGSHTDAWPSTKHALRAFALSIGIELVTGVAIATTWVIGVTIS